MVKFESYEKLCSGSMIIPQGAEIIEGNLLNSKQLLNLQFVLYTKNAEGCENLQKNTIERFVVVVDYIGVELADVSEKEVIWLTSVLNGYYDKDFTQMERDSQYSLSCTGS